MVSMLGDGGKQASPYELGYKYCTKCGRYTKTSEKRCPIHGILFKQKPIQKRRLRLRGDLKLVESKIKGSLNTPILFPKK
jgi:hypothetical protein